ncbi:hypothetical protein [Chlamydia vaughanii]|uniref:hypothetical protein n=1 Tax=Chlamydia vaughanii TaxID=3112552 RepID=UPI0032B306CC
MVPDICYPCMYTYTYSLTRLAKERNAEEKIFSCLSKTPKKNLCPVKTLKHKFFANYLCISPLLGGGGVTQP